MPERPAFSEAATASASLPIDETMPRPVMTTRRMARSSRQSWNSPTFMSVAV